MSGEVGHDFSFSLPILITSIGSNTQWQKVSVFPQFKGENAQFKEQ